MIQLKRLPSLLKYMFTPPTVGTDYLQRTEAFLADMKLQTNPKALRRWAHQELRQALGPIAKDRVALSRPPLLTQRVKLDYIPGYLTGTGSQAPTAAYLEPNDGTPFIHVYWQNSRGRWGLKIGPTDYDPTRDNKISKPGMRERHLEWVPGIYAWSQWPVGAVVR